MPLEKVAFCFVRIFMHMQTSNLKALISKLVKEQLQEQIVDTLTLLDKVSYDLPEYQWKLKFRGNENVVIARMPGSSRFFLEVEKNGTSYSASVEEKDGTPLSVIKGGRSLKQTVRDALNAARKRSGSI